MSTSLWDKRQQALWAIYYWALSMQPKLFGDDLRALMALRAAFDAADNAYMQSLNRLTSPPPALSTCPECNQIFTREGSLLCPRCEGSKNE